MAMALHPLGHRGVLCCSWRSITAKRGSLWLLFPWVDAIFNESISVHSFPPGWDHLPASPSSHQASGPCVIHKTGLLQLLGKSTNCTVPHTSHQAKSISSPSLLFQDTSVIPHTPGPRRFHNSDLSWLLRFLSLWKARGQQALNTWRQEGRLFWTSQTWRQREVGVLAPSQHVCLLKPVTETQNWILVSCCHLADRNVFGKGFFFKKNLFEKIVFI